MIFRQHVGMTPASARLWRLSVGATLVVALLMLSGCDLNIDPTAWNQMLETLQKNFPAVTRLIFAIAYLAGIFFIFSALHKLRAYGEARTMMPSHAQLGGPLTQFALGIALMFLPSVVTISVASLWGEGSLMAWPTISYAVSSQVWDTVFGIIRILGYIAMVRGLMLMARSTGQGAQQGTFGKGMVHLIGGILAANIGGTIRMIAASFGINLV
ncbi:MAG: type IV secretion protein IcmC [Gammaproteobacteria bacterium]|nr:type IV secretion protein IcmC [Gammaproteobacteria bacterium]